MPDSKYNSRAAENLGARARTESLKDLRALYKNGPVSLPIFYDDLPPRPVTRGDCDNVPRPCPYVGCRYSLYLEVSPKGSIRYLFPDRDPEDMPVSSSCALDVAERGGLTLRSVGRIANVTRERVRQIEEMAVAKVRRRKTNLGDFVEFTQLEALT